MAEDLERGMAGGLEGCAQDIVEPPAEADPIKVSSLRDTPLSSTPPQNPPSLVNISRRRSQPSRLATLRAERQSALVGWWEAASPNLRGSVMMIGAFTLFAVMVTCIKLVGSRIPIPQILIVRQVVMLIILIAFVGRALPRLIRTERPSLQLARGVFSLGAMLCGFIAIVHMPLAEATAIGFSQVLFVTVAAVAILREVVDVRRWIAIAAGFCGVLIMLKPTGEAVNGYALLAIFGAMFGAGITITVRILGDRENTTTILLWQGAIILAALALPGWWLWVTPTAAEWALMIALGIVGLGGQWLITRAYQIGEASALAPLDFVRLLLATVSGYLVFAEIPGIVTIIGATLVVGGTLYTMRRNAAPRAEASVHD